MVLGCFRDLRTDEVSHHGIPQQELRSAGCVHADSV